MVYGARAPQARVSRFSPLLGALLVDLRHAANLERRDVAHLCCLSVRLRFRHANPGGLSPARCVRLRLRRSVRWPVLAAVPAPRTELARESVSQHAFFCYDEPQNTATISLNNSKGELKLPNT